MRAVFQNSTEAGDSVHRPLRRISGSSRRAVGHPWDHFFAAASWPAPWREPFAGAAFVAAFVAGAAFAEAALAGAFFAGAFVAVAAFVAASPGQPGRRLSPAPSWREPQAGAASSPPSSRVRPSPGQPWPAPLAGAFVGRRRLRRRLLRGRGLGGRAFVAAFWPGRQRLAQCLRLPERRPARLGQRAGAFYVALERGAGAETGRLGLGDPDTGAGVGLRACAGGALDALKGAEARDADLLALGDGADDGCPGTASRASLAALRDPEGLLERLDQICLVHYCSIEVGAVPAELAWQSVDPTCFEGMPRPGPSPSPSNLIALWHNRFGLSSVTCEVWDQPALGTRWAACALVPIPLRHRMIASSR